MRRYTIGIDVGTLSGRAVLLDVDSGEIVASSVYAYPHAVMDEQLPSGVPLPQGSALQHPEDYILALKEAIPELLCCAQVDAEAVVGFGFDFTACTILPVDGELRPLCMQEKYENEPHAYVKLWKHHTAIKEAEEATRIAESRGEPWLKRYGGKISSEWMVPKVWEVLNEAPSVYEDTARFMTAADWISYRLTGRVTQSAPFAGYKALWNEETGFPSADYFETLDPRLKSFVGEKIPPTTDSIRQSVGVLNAEGAALIGLCEGTPIAMPVLDAHASMPATGVTEEGNMLLILGTSGVQLIHSKEKREIAGICGFMKDGVVPGYYTYEAGQICCGDHFDWFVKRCVPVEYREEANACGMSIHRYLRQKAQMLSPGESGLLALDWFNGNRSVLVDSELSGMILGLTLQTKPEEIYRALIEGTAFGARVIFETFAQAGICPKRIVAAGGIAEKDEMMMQIYADVLGKPITVPNAPMSASRGSAIYASVVAGIYPDLSAAAEKLAVRDGKTYLPIAENVVIYDRLYREYRQLHDYFGRGENDVMKRLRAIQRNEAL